MSFFCYLYEMEWMKKRQFSDLGLKYGGKLQQRTKVIIYI